MRDDTYKTIRSNSPEVLFKEKNSKFYGYAYPIFQEQDVRKHIETLKKIHHSARHCCYAYQIGTAQREWRANDDGEPNNSAGMPILGQIQSFELTNVLVVVVRYFGGVKLGVGGLIQAYKTSAQMALEHSEIIEKTIDVHYKISFDYKNLNKVMRIIKEKNLDIVTQEMELNCKIQIKVRQKNAESTFDIFKNLYEIVIQKIEK
jgi:uncharacterized YigZ family protein